MTLEQQLITLEKLGIQLNKGITIENLLHFFDRNAYEEKPFDLLLYILGINVEQKPWGRPFCSRVWNFDTECISKTGDYVAIVKRLCQVAGMPNLITDIQDFVDLNAGHAWLKYTIDGIQREWPVEVVDSWADTLTLSYVMEDIERDGLRFYIKYNGQAMILFFFDAHIAEELNHLSNNALRPVLDD
ncbi:MAG: hypothetical protein PVI90_06420 [Desulfobacteraceae bacterium]|jgi:hypothetical protein